MINVVNNSYSLIMPPWNIEDYELDKFLLASEIVDGTFNFFQIEREVKDAGRNPWDLKNMMKLIHFGEIEKISSSIVLRDRAKYDFRYIAFCGGITPSDRSIREYRSIYSKIQQLIMSFTLVVTNRLDFSSFYHVSGDGTIKLAYNSPFNIFKRKDIRLLIKHFMVEELSKKEIKSLRKSAKKFLYNNKVSDDDKINILFDLYDKLELTGQDSIPLWDVDARLMKVKDKGQIYKKFAYNIQLCVDTESKLICGVNVSQNLTRSLSNSCIDGTNITKS